MTDQLSQATRQTTQLHTATDAELFRLQAEQHMRNRLTSRHFSRRETDWPLRSAFVTTSKRGVML